MTRPKLTSLSLPAILLIALASSAFAQGRPAGRAKKPPTAAPSAAPPATTAPATGQPPPQALPPGHPPVDAAAQNEDDETASDEALPPGHPAVGGNGGEPGAMHGQGRGRSLVVDDPSIPRGTIVLQVRGPGGRSPSAANAKLKIRHQTIASGTTTTPKVVPIDAQGNARFDGLTIGSEWAYSLTLDYAGVPYEVPMFQLSAQAGKRLEMNVFDTTGDLDAALVGVRAIIFVEPQEKAFAVEQLFQFANLSDKTWRSDGVVISLPRGFKAFNEGEEHGTLAVTELPGRGFKLTGYASPGSTQVVVRYQVPFGDEETLRIAFGMPPRVAHLRVIGAIPSSMTIRADGLPPPEASEGENGRHMQVAEGFVQPGGDQIESTVVVLTGLPTQGSGRWIALGLCGLAVVSGLGVAAGKKEPPANEAMNAEAARKALLQELEGLERAHRAGDVGPKTYEHTRRTLIDRLAALLAVWPKQGAAG